MRHSKLFFMIFIIAIFAFSCNKATTEKDRYTNENIGFSFAFPNGWSQLTETEWEDLQLGDNKSLITIMDKNRRASFVVINVPLGPAAAQLKNLSQDMIEMQLAQMVEGIDRAGPDRFEDYKLISKDYSEFGGIKWAEIQYQGRNVGKDLRWNRIVLGINPHTKNKLLMVVFSSPLDEKEQYMDDFGKIEQSWKWLEE